MVVPDDPASHKTKVVRAAIRAAGAPFLMLPPHGPGLNPIEHLFATLEHLLRKAEPRTVEAEWAQVCHRLDRFSADECANALKTSGYAAVRK